MNNKFLTLFKKEKGFASGISRIIIFVMLLFSLDYFVSVILERGINRFYGLGSDADVLMIGHSHLMLAIDKRQLEERSGLSVAKYTREGVNVADRYIMLKQYFQNPSSKCKLIVYSIDPWLFTEEGLSSNSYTLFYPFIDNPEIDTYVHKYAKNPLDYYGHKLFRSSRFNVILINASLRGYLGKWTNLKIGQLDTVKLKKEISTGEYRRIRFDKNNIEIFRKTLEFLGESGKTVILMNAPVSDILENAVQSDYDKVFSIIRDMSSKYTNIHIVDLSPKYGKDSSLFFDPIHMNPDGQKVVTKEFSDIVYSVIGRN